MLSFFSRRESAERDFTEVVSLLNKIYGLFTSAFRFFLNM